MPSVKMKVSPEISQMAEELRIAYGMENKAQLVGRLIEQAHGQLAFSRANAKGTSLSTEITQGPSGET